MYYLSTQRHIGKSFFHSFHENRSRGYIALGMIKVKPLPALFLSAFVFISFSQLF